MSHVSCLLTLRPKRRGKALTRTHRVPDCKVNHRPYLSMLVRRPPVPARMLHTCLRREVRTRPKLKIWSSREPIGKPPSFATGASPPHSGGGCRGASLRLHIQMRECCPSAPSGTTLAYAITTATKSEPGCFDITEPRALAAHCNAQA